MSDSDTPLVARRKPALSARTVAILIAVALSAVASFALYNSYTASREESERRQRERRREAIAEVKAGKSDIVIFDLELFEMLVDDPQCVDGVTSAYFFMVDLGDPRFQRVRELRNVREVGFYSCQNVDTVLAVGEDMDSVQELYFESTDISSGAMRSMAKFRNLKKVIVQQDISDEAVARMRESLPNASIELSGSE